METEAPLAGPAPLAGLSVVEISVYAQGPIAGLILARAVSSARPLVELWRQRAKYSTTRHRSTGFGAGGAAATG